MGKTSSGNPGGLTIETLTDEVKRLEGLTEYQLDQIIETMMSVTRSETINTLENIVLDDEIDEQMARQIGDDVFRATLVHTGRLTLAAEIAKKCLKNPETPIETHIQHTLEAFLTVIETIERSHH